MATERTFDQLNVKIFPDEEALGRAAATLAADILKAVLEERGEANLILATGNSQLAFLRHLIANGAVNWSRVRLFHMDEYLGMNDTHPASFRRFMGEKVLSQVTPLAFHGIRGDASDADAECQRYANLLSAHPPDLCCLGIGENGHLAFNDPPFADFNDSERVKVVSLDPVSRKQQVGEGHFATLEDVPERAITLTIPALLSADKVIAVVPETRKARAVASALTGPLTQACPASVLRETEHATLILDKDSASLLNAGVT